MEVTERVSQTFNGKKVLITGGTGFIGKVLIEKLLRLCPKIGGIILLIREKKDRTPKQRVEDIFNNPLFSTLVSSRSKDELLSLVTAVTGNMLEKDLGLNDRDRAICQTANIIVHSAATVRFDERIKTAVLLNTRGTKCMLELAKQCSHLELFIHVSTAYCYPNEKILEEQLYPPPSDPEKVINMMETIDDATIDVLTSKYLGEYPNTYSYSKALSESLVERAMGSIPAVIVRPSVVIPILNDPIKGWAGNINGPMGLFIGAGKGVIRSMYGDDQGYADFVPVDCVINAIMTITWDYLENGCRHNVMNLTSSAEIRVTWKELLDVGRDIVQNTISFDNVLWYPGGCITKYRWLHRLKGLFYHWLPALLIDTMLFCFGFKPLLLRIQTRISKNFEVFEFYTNNQWQFKSDRLILLRNKLTSTEKKIYVMDAEGLNIHEYFKHAVLSARRYILKEKDENLPRARQHMKMLWFLNVAVKGFFYIYVPYRILVNIMSLISIF